MKKTIFGLIALAGLSLTACNDANDTAATNADSTMNTTTATTNNQSTMDYSARADSFTRNSEAGKYMDAQTGRPLRINVDRTSGSLTNAENNQPVTRYIYVDNNDWWAYDAEGTRLGRARYENNKVMYEGDNSNWVEYDVKFKDDKIKTDGMKIKTDEDGETKIKTENQKIKIDKDGDRKVKNDN